MAKKRMYKAIILRVVPNLFSQRKHFVFGGENQNSNTACIVCGI